MIADAFDESVSVLTGFVLSDAFDGHELTHGRGLLSCHICEGGIVKYNECGDTLFIGDLPAQAAQRFEEAAARLFFFFRGFLFFTGQREFRRDRDVIGAPVGRIDFPQPDHGVIPSADLQPPGLHGPVQNLVDAIGFDVRQLSVTVHFIHAFIQDRTGFAAFEEIPQRGFAEKPALFFHLPDREQNDAEFAKRLSKCIREKNRACGNKNGMIDLKTIVGMHYFIQLILYFFKSLNSKELVEIIECISKKEGIVYDDFQVLFNAALKLLFQDKKIVKITGNQYSSYKLTDTGFKTMKLMITDCTIAGLCDRIRVKLMHNEFYKSPHS